MENSKTEGLSITIEDVGPCKKRLDIEVPKEEIDGQLKKRFREVGATAKVSGFRKGKIPRSIIERQFGKQIEEEVKESLVKNAYQEAVNLHKLDPVGYPELGKVEFDPKKVLKFDITLEVKPAVEAGNYKGLKLLRRSTVVTSEEIESALKNISLSKMQLVTEEKGNVEGNDQVICDYKVLVDGKVIHQDEEVAVWVPGGAVADIPVPELFVALKGAKPGEKREAEANLGSGFHLPEYRDKEATLEIVISEIKRPRTPEINDELAKQLGAPSLDGLRAEVRKRLEMDKKGWVEEDLQAQIYQKLSDMADFELPADLVAAQTDERLYRHKMELLQKGLPTEEVEKEGERLKNASYESVVRDLKLSLILEDIAGKEKIYVTEQEVEKRIQRMAAAYQTTTAKMRRELEKHGSLSALRHQMRESKVLELIRKEAVVEDEKTEDEKIEDKKKTEGKQKAESKNSIKEKQKTEKKQKVGQKES
ncbi:MAG: trigger factor [Candidatus Brocadiales bacterium]|nr:trigger factor [Candidatus Bathyanammoxibius sp.]